MQRLLAISALALLAVLAVASSASAATPRPKITSFSPSQVAVNGVLVIKGKNFRSGAANNRVFFSRATDGKTVRARPRKATKTRMEVVVPTAITTFLADNGTGGKKATRFQIAIFTKTLGPKTSKSRSPIILPAGTKPTTGGGGGGGTTVPGATAADCDGDGVPNTDDNDDDNDLISDDTEGKIGTDPCKADTDGDGIEDGYEYYSALDLNSAALPYPGAKPFPNPLDGSDAGKDFDHDGLTDAEESAAWGKFGGHALPLNYSAGNKNTGGTPDGTDDADSDGLNNLTELAKLATDAFNPARAIGDPSQFQLDWLNPDTDGDTINDGADDQDHDGLSNVEEITLGDDGLKTDPENAASGSPDCDADGVPNSQDGDDDNDGLSDTTEKTIGTSQCNKDTDGDGVEDGFEQASALNLNGNALPYPGKKPYPNALDGSDAKADYDGDGLTLAQEFALWIKFGGHTFPLNYSDGNQTSPASSAGGMDLDNNGRITDEEKDADGDGLPNWIEIANIEPAPSGTCTFTDNTGPNAGLQPGIFTTCGVGTPMPNGETFRAPDKTVTGASLPPDNYQLDYTDADTDGDGVNDGNDDQDHDGLSNLEEITAGTDTFYTDPIDPCDPNVDSPTCPTHSAH